MRFLYLGLATALFAATTPAFAQDAPADPPPAVTVSGSVGIASDYRFRGVSQTDRDLALQGGITATHESGFYVGTWGSNLSGWGTFGGANLELDVIAGFKTPIGGDGAALDVGVTWYMYPGGADETDFFEPYAKLSGIIGPATLTASAYYAPKQNALGFYTASLTPFIAGDGRAEDNLYLAGDAVVAVPTTPVTLKAHVGYSDGNPGLGPNGTSLAPNGRYWDWSLGADFIVNRLTFSVAYVDTDITARDSAYLQPNFSRTSGGTIAGATIVGGLSVAF